MANPESGHIAEEIVEVYISEALPSEENMHPRSQVCEGASCAFSDSRSSSTEAKERSASMWKLGAAIILCTIFMTIEIVCGKKARSLAILSDAVHMSSDIAGFLISLFSVWAAGRQATPRHSFGCLRIEILGMLISILLIWALNINLAIKAVLRLINGVGEVKGPLMFGIGSFGFGVYILMLFILGHDHGHVHRHGHGHEEHDHGHGEDDVENAHNHEVSDITHQQHHHDPDHSLRETRRRNINVQGALLHTTVDIIQNTGVMVAAGVIWLKPKFKIIDPICTLIFSVIALYPTIKMFRDVLEVLMESTPREIDATSLERGLCDMDEVVAINELHIRAITVGKVELTCHVRIQPEADGDMVRYKVVDYINREYNISHVTI